MSNPLQETDCKVAAFRALLGALAVTPSVTVSVKSVLFRAGRAIRATAKTP